MYIKWMDIYTFEQENIVFLKIAKVLLITLYLHIKGMEAWIKTKVLKIICCLDSGEECVLEDLY